MSHAKVMCGDRIVAFVKIGIYKAHKRTELENDMSIMEKGQQLALPVILDDVKTHNSEGYTILFDAIEVPDSMYKPTTDKKIVSLVIHADTENDALALVYAIDDISNTCKDTIERLGLRTSDLVARIDNYRANGMTSEQAIATLKQELKNQR